MTFKQQIFFWIGLFSNLSGLFFYLYHQGLFQLFSKSIFWDVLGTFFLAGSVLTTLGIYLHSEKLRKKTIQPDIILEFKNNTKKEQILLALQNKNLKPLSLKIHNIGFNLAKNIHIKMYTNLEPFVKQFLHNDPDLYSFEEKFYNDNIVGYTNQRNIRFEKSEDYLLLKLNQDSTVERDLNFIFFDYLEYLFKESIIWDKFKENCFDIINGNYPPLLIIVKYKDMLDIIHNKYYKLTLKKINFMGPILSHEDLMMKEIEREEFDEKMKKLKLEEIS